MGPLSPSRVPTEPRPLPAVPLQHPFLLCGQQRSLEPACTSWPVLNLLVPSPIRWGWEQPCVSGLDELPRVRCSQSIPRQHRRHHCNVLCPHAHTRTQRSIPGALALRPLCPQPRSAPLERGGRLVPEVPAPQTGLREAGRLQGPCGQTLLFHGKGSSGHWSGVRLPQTSALWHPVPPQ